MINTVSKIRLLIVDDHPLTRAGIRSTLENQSDIEIVAEATNGNEAKTLAVKMKPDVVLLDLVMPESKPTEICSWIRKNCPGAEILILTGHTRDSFLARLMESGAIGFLDKNEPLKQVVYAVRQAYLGQMIYSEDQVQRAIRWKKLIGDRWDELSSRERQVLEWMVQGYDNRLIADTLGISVNTVRCHNRHIFEKLGVANRSEAIALVLHHGLLDI